MEVISEAFKSRSVQSVRLNDKLVEVGKMTGIPLNNIVESCLVHFCTLNDEDRLKLLHDYSPDKVDSTKVRESKYNIAERAINTAKENLGKQADGTSTKLLLAVGIGLLAALFLSKE